MKKLIILRHAKSSWKDQGVTDFERKLNKRGKAQIPEIGEFFKNDLNLPDVFITSPAKRTKKTAKKIADIIIFDKARIVNDIRVYEAELDTLIRIISEIGETFETVCICGHNPGLSELIYYLTGEPGVDLPTCGLCMIELDILSWKSELNKKGKITYYKIPQYNESSEL